MKTKKMILNRETAMRLWVKHFGKATKAKDFAGRVMVKGAYNDRNSDYGWNVDHILPQSRGGVTADHNLVCCHILTNDEKSNKFPCFKANGQKFEILKFQNHYEIRLAKNQNKSEEQDDDEVNFFDSAQGIRFYKDLKGTQNKQVFVGTVHIRLKTLQNTAIIDFIQEIFSLEHFHFKQDNYTIEIIIQDFDMPQKEDIQNLLDKCVLINTYLQEYFIPMGIIRNYSIFYGVDCFEQKKNLYGEDTDYHYGDYPMVINYLVRLNTDAKDVIKENDYLSYSDTSRYKVYQYNYTYTKLKENLRKEVSGK